MPERSPPTIARALSLIGRRDASTRRAIQRPPIVADDDEPDERGDQRADEDTAQPHAFFDVVADEQAKAARQQKDARDGAMMRGGVARAQVIGHDNTRLRQNAFRQADEILPTIGSPACVVTR